MNRVKKHFFIKWIRKTVFIANSDVCHTFTVNCHQFYLLSSRLYDCSLNSYFPYFSLLLIPLLKLLLLLLLLLLLYQYYFFLLNLLFESFNMFVLFTSIYRVTSDFFEKNQVQFKNNSRIFQVHFWAAIFPYTTKYDDRQAHLKLILLLLACSKIEFILCTYLVTFLKQLVKSGI